MQSEAIAEVLKQTSLFQTFSDIELKLLSKQALIKDFSSGELIFSEGDIGDLLYIIVSGAVRVFLTRTNEEEIVLARLEKGQFFGEQALLGPTCLKRNASVRALLDTQTIAIPYQAFQHSLKVNPQLQELLKEIGDKQLRIKCNEYMKTNLSSLHDDLSKLSSQIRSFKEREVLFWQGDPADQAFYLINGSIEIRFYGNDKRLISRSRMIPGSLFGERGLLDNQQRAGTAVCLEDSEVAVIEGALLKQLYQSNEKLHSLIETSFELYRLPLRGIVIQYQDTLLGRPVVNTSIQKLNGEILIASRLLNGDMFSICYKDIKETQRESYSDEQGRSRELLLNENKLIGVISLGKWDDLTVVFKAVNEKWPLSPNDRNTFQHSGTLPQFQDAPSFDTIEGNLCDCMQIKTQTIKQLISEGITTVEGLSKKTGAGTVCGGCRPRLAAMLGVNVWTYVTISHIVKHTDSIRSFQLRPIQGRPLPYKAGQHLVVAANIEGNWIARSYTLTSTDIDTDYYEITIKREEQGLFSRWLFDHGVIGTSLRVSSPQGEFVCDSEKKEPAIFFVAGIGMTPSVAFIRKRMASGTKRMLYVDYTVRSRKDIAFAADFEKWSTCDPDLHLRLRVTDESGRLDKNEIMNILKQYLDPEIYICGPKSYEKAIKEMILQAGIPPHKIFKEEFTHTGGPLKLNNKLNA